MEVDQPAAVVKVKPRRDDAPSIATDFSHPVYKRLSQINGAINRLEREELVRKLVELHLSAAGAKEVLRKRLKNYYKREKLVQNHLKESGESRYDYILVIDFEATCKKENPSNYRHEIIEFPVVVIDCTTKSIVDQFHSYVRPVGNPVLTSFCTELTGITQDMVDRSETFPVVLDRMWNWVISHKYHKHMVVLTDGPWDMSRFMFQSCQLHRIKIAKWCKRWINIRKAFSNFYDSKRMCLHSMLEASGFIFDGQPHCGLDDSKNIARIAVRLLEDGWTPLINERMHCRKLEANKRMAAAAATGDDQTADDIDNDDTVELETLSREQARNLESDSDSSSEDSGNRCS